MEKKQNPLKGAPAVDESKLVCKIGDVVVVRRSERTNEGEGEEIRHGSKYRVTGRVYYGWDLELIEGDGPSQVRVLNSELLSFFELKQS